MGTSYIQNSVNLM